MKYRKKPVVIDAMLYDGTNAEAIREWSGGCVQFGNDDDPPQLTIPTLEGVMLADVGNYIIRGVAGEYYPCKAEIFHATYESAGDINFIEECLDEIDALEAQVERDAGARALWDAHFGHPVEIPTPESPFEITQMGEPDPAYGWTDKDNPTYTTDFDHGLVAKTMVGRTAKFGAYLRGECLGTFDTKKEALEALRFREADDRG